MLISTLVSSIGEASVWGSPEGRVSICVSFFSRLAVISAVWLEWNVIPSLATDWGSLDLGVIRSLKDTHGRQFIFYYWLAAKTEIWPQPLFVFWTMLALLLHSSGDSSVNGPSESVTVLAGEVAILPCSFNISASDEFPTVEWSKQHLVPNVIFLYRDGCEDHEMKHPDFRYRTGFITPELKNGIISLRISSVKRSDSGMYQCMRLWGSGQTQVTTVELIVGWFRKCLLESE